MKSEKVTHIINSKIIINLCYFCYIITLYNNKIFRSILTSSFITVNFYWMSVLPRKLFARSICTSVTGLFYKKTLSCRLYF